MPNDKNSPDPSQEQGQGPLPLEYHFAESRYRRGATRPARLVAGIFSSVFAMVTVSLWVSATESDQSNRLLPDGGFLPAMLVSLTGAIVCLLIALGVIGKHKRLER